MSPRLPPKLRSGRRAFRVALSLAILGLTQPDGSLANDIVVETRSGERLLLRGDGTYYHLPPADGKIGHPPDRRAAGGGRGSAADDDVWTPPNHRGSQWSDQTAPPGPPLPGAFDSPTQLQPGWQQGVPLSDPAYGYPGGAVQGPGFASPYAPQMGGQGSGSYALPSYANPGMTPPHGAMLPGLSGGAQAFRPGLPAGTTPGGMLMPTPRRGYERIEFRDLWDSKSPSSPEPDRSFVELRGWISSYGKLDQAMLFPTRNVTWEYVMLGSDMLADEDRREFTRDCRGVCEVVVQGKLKAPRGGKPQVEAHRLTILR